MTLRRTPHETDLCVRLPRVDALLSIVYRKGLKLWKALLGPLTPATRRELALASRKWPPTLQRRLASALGLTARRSWHVPNEPPSTLSGL